MHRASPRGVTDLVVLMGVVVGRWMRSGLGSAMARRHEKPPQDFQKRFGTCVIGCGCRISSLHDTALPTERADCSK